MPSPGDWGTWPRRTASPTGKTTRPRTRASVRASGSPRSTRCSWIPTRLIWELPIPRSWRRSRRGMTPRSRRRGAGFPVATLVAAFIALVGMPPAAVGSPSLDYVYVDAGEGGSSGGHAGLRLGDLVYHFEFVPPGLVRLRRQTFERFARQYTLVENRTVQVSRMPVDLDT